MGPTSSDQHYAKVLDLKQAAQLVIEPGVLWQAAQADAEAAGGCESVDMYLQRVDESAAEFLLRDELHDREALVVRCMCSNTP